jgi:NMD protein affecting ribosome stability and mRNA decay
MNCNEYVFASERICPHCDAAQPRRRRRVAPAEPRVQMLMDQIDHHARQIMELVYGVSDQKGAAERAPPDQTISR